MVRSKTPFYLFAFLMLNANCRKLKDCDSKEKFTLVKTAYTGNAIRTDGYYFSDGSLPTFFYRNGVLFLGTISNTPNSMAIVESQIVSGALHEKMKNNMDAVCLFNINNDEIKYESFNQESELQCWYPVIITGKILNDTTILFNHKINSDGTNEEAINYLWHFKAFSPKPDSTNSIIP